MFPYVPQTSTPAWDDTWLRPNFPVSSSTLGVRDDHYVWPTTPGFAPGASGGFLTAQGYVPAVPYQPAVQMQVPTGWTIPTHFVPLPPSPSMLAATMLPLPPSPRSSPRLGPVQLQPVISAPVLGVPQWYNHNPIDPYYLPQAGVAYQNPQFAPRTRVHPILSTDTPYLIFNLASSTYKPLTYSQNPTAYSHGPSFLFSRSGLSTTPVHRGYLEQVASYPATHRMTIKLAAFNQFENAWKITVDPGRYILVGDVLGAIYAAMHVQVTQEEWSKVSDREFREASEAYTRRCKHADVMERNKGVLRVDMLGTKHYYAGIARAKDDDVHNFKMFVKGPPSKD